MRREEEGDRDRVKGEIWNSERRYRERIRGKREKCKKRGGEYMP